MSNDKKLYTDVRDVYDTLPSDSEPGKPDTDDNRLIRNGVAQGLEETVVTDLGQALLRDNEDLDTDISSVTDMDSVPHNLSTIGRMTNVERILSDKLNLIINSHRIIIARLDGIQEEIERCIMQRLDIDGKPK